MERETYHLVKSSQPGIVFCIPKTITLRGKRGSWARSLIIGLAIFEIWFTSSLMPRDNGHYYLNEASVAYSVIASRYPEALLPGVSREPDGVIAIEATCSFRGGYCYWLAALRCTPQSHTECRIVLWTYIPWRISLRHFITGRLQHSDKSGLSSL